MINQSRKMEYRLQPPQREEATNLYRIILSLFLMAILIYLYFITNEIDGYFFLQEKVDKIKRIVWISRQR